MKKRKSSYSIIIFTLAVVGVFGVSTDAQSIKIDPFLIYSGNIHQLSVDEINALIKSANHSSYPIISEDSRPFHQTEIVVGDIKSYVFNGLNTEYFITKEGNKSYVYYVSGINTLHWESNDKKGLSYYASVSVPEPSDMILLGALLLFLVAIQRKKVFR